MATEQTNTDTDIHLIPLTEQELQDLRLFMYSKMLQLSNEAKSGKIDDTIAQNDLNRLERVNDKVSRFVPNKRHKSSVTG